MMLAALLLGLALAADPTLAAGPAPSPSPSGDSSVGEPAEGHGCANSTLKLGDGWPAGGAKSATGQDVVDIRRFYMDSVVGPPFLAGWLYVARNGEQGFEPKSSMTQAERNLVVDALRNDGLTNDASSVDARRAGMMSLQSSDEKAKMTAFFSKHGTLHNCFTKPLGR